MEIGPFWGEINLGNCDTRYTTTNNLLKLNQVNSLYISFPLKTYAVYSPVSVLSRTDYMGEIGSLPDGTKSQAVPLLGSWTNLNYNESGLDHLGELVHFTTPYHFT